MAINVETLETSINKLESWLVKNNFKGYDPFDGLSSPLRILTLQNKFLEQSFQQFVRRIPLNIRPIIGIKKKLSSKGMGYIGGGYLNLFELTKDNYYKNKATHCFNWLTENYSKNYKGYSWGNAFDYTSRAFYLPKNSPTLVWTSLIGHFFVKAYQILGDTNYLKVINGIKDFILNEIPLIHTEKGICLSYIVDDKVAIHNANFLGARMLSEIYSITNCEDCKKTAIQCINYGINCQREDGSWYYGEEEKYHWIDNWHTAYNLEALKLSQDILKITDWEESINKGLNFYAENFFTREGAPKYYWDRVYKYDIQSASQAIDTFVLFSHLETEYLDLAKKIADWTIKNMQSPHGYFYLWKNKFFTNKTPTIHWGAGTMFHALSNLLKEVKKYEN